MLMKVTVMVEATLMVDRGTEDGEQCGTDLAAEMVKVCKAKGAKVVERNVKCQQ